jgi:hypothetical protein
VARVYFPLPQGSCNAFHTEKFTLPVAADKTFYMKREENCENVSSIGEIYVVGVRT